MFSLWNFIVSSEFNLSLILYIPFFYSLIKAILSSNRKRPPHHKAALIVSIFNFYSLRFWFISTEVISESQLILHTLFESDKTHPDMRLNQEGQPLSYHRWFLNNIQDIRYCSFFHSQSIYQCCRISCTGIAHFFEWQSAKKKLCILNRDLPCFYFFLYFLYFHFHLWFTCFISLILSYTLQLGVYTKSITIIYLLKKSQYL